MKVKSDTPEQTAATAVDIQEFGPMVMPIDGPLNVTFNGNRLDINIVMGLAGRTEGLPTILRLTPEASGQLVGAIKKAIDERLIHVSVGQPRPLQ
jgi:hypothetical protein